MKHTVRRCLIASLGLGALAVVGPVSAVGAAATTPAVAPVPQGIDAGALPGAVPFGTTPPATPESVSFILHAHNLPTLKQAVDQGVSTFLSVAQFAAAYGQSPSAVYALEVYLSQFGIRTQSYADGLDVSATGTAGAFDQALGVQQQQYRVPGRAGHAGAAAIPAQTIHGTSQTPQLPTRLAREVLTILGLTNYAPFTSNAVHARQSVTAADGASANHCIKLTGSGADCNLPTNFEAEYGLTPLAQAGATGAGQTIGIVTLAAMDPGAPQYFWKHELNLPTGNRTVMVENVDGGPGAPSDASGTGETDLDVEQSGGVAPGANVVVYQAPNTDAGFADAFFGAASQNVASTVSASWGESETYVQAAVASGTETPYYQAAFDEAFLEMAMQGQSGFLSAGDSGAYDASADLGSTNLSVDTSADSPYVTAAGGTTLPWTGTLTGSNGVSATVTVPAQRAWGWDYLWPAFAATQGTSLAAAAEANVAGGGGGFSVLEPSPSYQQGVSGTSTYQAVQYLTPTTPQNLGITVPTAWTFDPTPAVTHGRSSGRALPDLSADADPFSGYLLYEPSYGPIGQPLLQGGWGGTSFVAPQLNGAASVIDSYLGHRVGLWNPSLYSFATSARTPFTTLQQAGTGNDNVFYTGTPGAVYNQATGLGYPNLTTLANDFKG